MYTYDEGAIPFPDPTDTPSRTILTGEGGATPSRFKHLIKTEDGRFRRLTPRELERLNGFPGDWTVGMSDGRRAFMMGNALVVGAVEKVANELITDVGPASRRPFAESPRRAESADVWTTAAEPTGQQSSRSKRHARQPGARHGPELKLRRALRSAHLAGYRVNWRKAPGRPDIAYPGRQDRDLRARVLLAPLSAVLSEPPEIESRVLAAQVRAQSRARYAKTRDHRAGRLGRHRSLGVRYRKSPIRRGNPNSASLQPTGFPLFRVPLNSAGDAPQSSASSPTTSSGIGRLVSSRGATP